MGLPKVFDSLNYESLITGYKCYGLEESPTNAVKINILEKWKKVIAAVPEESVWVLYYSPYL